MNWEYKVVYVDFRGRIPIEGEEFMIEKGERRSAFVRAALDKLGTDGWELGGVHPLWPAETSYMIFKRASRGGVDKSKSEERSKTSGEAQSAVPSGETI